MPSIKVSDNLGLVLDIPVESPLKKYLRSDFVDLIALPSLRQELTKSLGESTLKPAGGGLNFKHKTDLGAGDAELVIEAGVNCGIDIVKESAGPIGDDLIGDPVTVPAGHAYVHTLLAALVVPAGSQEKGDITFGFESSGEVKLENYRLFPDAQSVGSAFQESLGGFRIPGDLADLRALPQDGIASVSGSGKLVLSVAAEITTAPNPLAIPGLPPAVPKIAVKAGTSVGVSAGLRIGGAYEVRVRKVNANTVRLGYYKKDESEFTVGVEASAGVKFGIGNQDWIRSILGAVSKDPKADAESLEQAGLAEDHIAEIESGIKAGVQRSVEASLKAELSLLKMGESAFLYDINLDTAGADETSRKAIHDALDGDLSRLQAGTLPAGVAIRRSVWKSTVERGLSLRVNLLGILNFVSVSKLLVEGTVVTDALTGEVTITDKATATRLRALMVNFGDNQEKIRKVFFEAMIATVTYRASDVLHDVDVTSTHSYFELHHKTNTQTMKDNLDGLEALGLIDGAGKAKALAHGEPFGRSTLLLEASYNDAQCKQIFFGDDGKPRAEAHYELAARRALAALIQPGDPDSERGAAVLDDALWKQLKNDGSPSGNLSILRKRFGAGASDSLLRAIDGDFAFIAAFWGRSLAETAKKLDKVRTFLKEHPDTKPDDHDFQTLRKDLAKHLGKVAKDTKERFGDPLGLVALHYASGNSGQVSGKLTCGAFSL